MNFEENIKKNNIKLPNSADPVGSYVATKIIGKLLYISGQISIDSEGKLIKETDFLKSSIPKVKRYQEIEPEIKALKAKKNVHWNAIQEIRAEEDALNKEMEEIRKELEQTNAQKD